MATKNYLARIQSKGLQFFFIVQYNPEMTSPIEWSLLEQHKKSQLVCKHHNKAEFVEIPQSDFDQHYKKHGHTFAMAAANDLSYLFQ